MKIQITTPWLGHPKGKILDLAPGLARTWIDHHRAIEYVEPEAKPSVIEKVTETITDSLGFTTPPPAGRKSQARQTR